MSFMIGGPGKAAIPAAVALAALLAGTSARAGGDEAAAEALFVEAKKLAARGKYAEACPKFAESNRLDRGAGTLIHLGDCYEKAKQTASAWAAYKEASSAAQALGRKDWEKLAAQRAAALEPKLARLNIKVDGANEKDGASRTEVSRDGTLVSQASWGVPIPVDIGPHSIEATSRGHKPFKASVSVTKDGETVEVTVPKLEPEASTAPPSAAAAAPPSGSAPPAGAKRDEGSGQRTVGVIVAGAGIVGLAAGAITGLMAMGKSSDAKAICASDGPCASRDAVDASQSASTLGLVSTVAFVAGGALVATGGVLYFAAPSGSERPRSAQRPRVRVRVAPSAGPAGGGLTVHGAF